jgi:hypothetical protein
MLLLPACAFLSNHPIQIHQRPQDWIFRMLHTVGTEVPPGALLAAIPSSICGLLLLVGITTAVAALLVAALLVAATVALVLAVRLMQQGFTQTGSSPDTVSVYVLRLSGLVIARQAW